MKTALIVTICLVLVAVIAAEYAKERPTRRPPTRRPLRRCNSGKDCDDDECCVGVPFLKGSCRRRGGEGARCNGDEEDDRGKYLVRCPCASGLDCVPQEVKETIFGQVRINERCKSGSKPEEVTTEVVQGSTEEPIIDTDEPILDTDES